MERQSLELTPAQQRTWNADMSELAKRAGITWTTIADELKRRFGGSQASWKSELSLFKKGDPKGLRVIFEEGDGRRLEVVARLLQRKPRDLEQNLARIRGETTEDPADEWRLPGFEDLGAQPILDVFFPPRCAKVTWRLPESPGDERPQPAGAQLDLDLLVRLVGGGKKGVPRAVILTGEPGMGRTASLRAICAKLAAADIAHSFWPECSAEVIVADDLDRLAHGERAHLVDVLQQGRTLIAATGPHDVCADLPEARAVLSLDEGDADWAKKFLTHLDERATRLREQHVGFVKLQRWIDSDPFALELAGRVDTLGALARVVSDEGDLATGLGELLDLRLRRAAELLQRRGRGAQSIFVNTRGGVALQRLATRATRAQVPEGEAVDVFAALGKADAVKDGAYGLVDAVVEAGLLRRAPEGLSFTPPALRVAALGRALADRLEGLERIVIDPGLHGALVVAAETIGDLAPVLSAIDQLAAPARCLAMPALTRVLACATPSTDRRAYRRAFMAAAAWWVQRAGMSTKSGRGSASARARAQEERLGGRSPLVVLALASVRHREELPRTITLEDVLAKGALDSPREEYLRLLGHQRSTPDPDLVAIACPAQAQSFATTHFWDRFRTTMWQLDGRDPLPLQQADLDDWLVFAGGPLLLESGAGKQILAGVSDVPIDAFMAASGRAATIWEQALADRLKDGGERAVSAFADAAFTAFTRSGARSRAAIQRAWVAGSNVKDAIGAAVAARLKGWVPPTHLAEDDFLRWIVATVLTTEQREDLWSTWTSAVASGEADASLRETDRVRSVFRAPGAEPTATLPWRLFLSAGLPRRVIASWAANTFEAEIDQLDAVEKFGAFRRSASGAAAALMELIATGDLEVLRHLMERRLDEVVPDLVAALRSSEASGARATRLSLAAVRRGPTREALLSGVVHPHSTEEPLWSAIAASSETEPEGVLRAVQWATAAGTKDAWAGAAGRVIALGEHLRAPARGFDREKGRPYLSPGFSILEIAPDPETWAHGALGEMRWRMAEIGAVLLMASESGQSEAALRVVEAMLAAPNLQGLIGGEALGLWVLVGKHLGWDRVVSVLRERAADAGLTAARLAAIWRLRKVDLSLARIEELLDDADLASVTAEVIARSSPERALALTQTRPLVAPSNTPNLVAVKLAQAALRAHANSTISVLLDRLAETPRVARRAWWSLVLSWRPPSEQALRAMTAYLAAHDSRVRERSGSDKQDLRRAKRRDRSGA